MSMRLLTIGTLCNDTTRSAEGELFGDPTETALIAYGDANGCGQKQCDVTYPRVAEIPFDSERKLMTTLHRKDETPIFVATKGGFDVLLAMCNRIEDNSKIRVITDADKKSLAAVNTSMAVKALRVLCMAYKEITITAESDAEQLEALTANAERDLIFVGMVGMIDPPREEARVAVEQCKRAGIKPVMITGDHKITASAIAQSLGIMTAQTRYLRVAMWRI